MCNTERVVTASPSLTPLGTPASSAGQGGRVRWTPKQQEVRRKVIEAAAQLIADEGLSACTFRAVATRAGLTKSTVSYYFDNANELVDLSVGEIMRRLADYAAAHVLDSRDAREAVEFLVRLFVNPGETPRELLFRDSVLWPAYTTHAWRRGAKEQIIARLDTLREVFRIALERLPEPPTDTLARADSLHSYLLGAMIRNMIEPLDRHEVARAVTALGGVQVRPERC